MADEPTAPAEPTPPVEPDVTPPAEPIPEPAPPDPVAEIRERLARLEGENQALRTQVITAAAPRQEPQVQWTPANIRQAYDAGQITDDQRVALLASLQTRAEIAQYDATLRVQGSQVTAGERLQEYMRAYPALNDPHSPLMREVAAELASLQADGYDPRDLRAQLRATKSVLGALRRPDAGSTSRRSIPIGSTGTPGSGTPGGPGGKNDPLKGIPEDVLSQWRTMGANLGDPAKAQFYANRYWQNEAKRGRSRSA